MSRDYQVVFEYTKQAKGYAGNRYSEMFKNQQEFEGWYNEENKKRLKVIAQGVSEKEGLELLMKAPVECRFSAAVQEATRKDGSVNEERLRYELSKNLADIHRKGCRKNTLGC